MVEEKRGPQRIYLSRKDLFVNNFLGGISWGIGSVLGATILLGIIGLLLNWLGGLPLIGRWIGYLSESIRQGIDSVRY